MTSCPANWYYSSAKQALWMNSGLLTILSHTSGSPNPITTQFYPLQNHLQWDEDNHIPGNSAFLEEKKKNPESTHS